MEKECPACGTGYRADLSFCPRDGTVLIAKRRGDGLIGQILAERYHILKRIGEGGFGQVYLAEHVKMGRMCAIKLMHPHLRRDPEAVRRFTREASNTSRISHGNVAQIYDFGETRDQMIYLVMEYVAGDSLATILRWEGPLQPGRAISIARQIAAGLGAAHDLSIVHRDLKPDNVQIGRSKDGDDLAKVLDFGIAKAVEASGQTLTRAGFVIGTAQYMSPEQMIGEPLDGRSDLYSLGCILFEMLSGQRVFAGPTGEGLSTRRLTEPPPRLRDINPQIQKSLDAVVSKALARRPGERFETAEELSNALGEVRKALSPERLITPWRTPAAQPEPKVDGATAESSPPVTGSTGTEVRMTGAIAKAARLRWAGASTLAVLAATVLVIVRLSGGPPPAATTTSQENPVAVDRFETDGAEPDRLTVAEAIAAPILTALTPARVQQGSAGFALSVRGENFVPGTRVRWNGVERAATFITSNELRLEIPASEVTSAGITRVSALHPGADGKESPELIFTTESQPAPSPEPAPSNPIPALRALSASSATAGEASLILTLRGSNFVRGAVVRWNGSSRPTTFVSATELRASIGARDLVRPATVQITVANPGPGGGTSSSHSFTIAAAPAATAPPPTGDRVAGPPSVPNPSAAPPVPAAPSNAALESARSRISAGQAAAAQADFETAFAAFRAAHTQLAGLQSEFPQSSDVRELVRQHASAVEAARRPCETLRGLRIGRGETPPNCNP
jgi:hypothetical protein